MFHVGLILTTDKLSVLSKFLILNNQPKDENYTKIDILTWSNEKILLSLTCNNKAFKYGCDSLWLTERAGETLIEGADWNWGLGHASLEVDGGLKGRIWWDLASYILKPITVCVKRKHGKMSLQE